jgi:hypothetical protein
MFGIQVALAGSEEAKPEYEGTEPIEEASRVIFAAATPRKW